MDDVFEVQDEIVRKVMVALVGKLETASLERAKRKPTDSLNSYEYLPAAAISTINFQRRSSIGN